MLSCHVWYLGLPYALSHGHLACEPAAGPVHAASLPFPFLLNCIVLYCLTTMATMSNQFERVCALRNDVLSPVPQGVRHGLPHPAVASHVARRISERQGPSRRPVRSHPEVHAGECSGHSQQERGILAPSLARRKHATSRSKLGPVRTQSMALAHSTCYKLTNQMP